MEESMTVYYRGMTGGGSELQHITVVRINKEFHSSFESAAREAGLLGVFVSSRKFIPPHNILSIEKN